MIRASVTGQVAALTVVSFDALGLGDRSYLLSDGEVGVVVDAQRDPTPYLQEAERLGIAITAVFETHIHNDYVSGGLALSRATGATYAIPAGEPVSFSDKASALEDGDALFAGNLQITAISTVGHTDHHLAYLVELADGAKAERTVDHVVCTGGSLLVSSTGRTDLLGLPSAEALARSQWRSVRHLLTSLPGDTPILPTHGFGSFCSATPTSGGLDPVPTLARELEQNPAALLDEDEFVASVLAHLPPIPAYYRHMAPLNRKGPRAPLFEPVPMLEPARLQEAIEGDVHRFVDLRGRRVFAAGHLPGTLNLELGINLTTYLGWVVPWDAGLVLLAEDEAEIDEARRLIARIGREELSGAALWSKLALEHRANPAADGVRVSSYRVASFSELAAESAGRPLSELQVLDVRHPHEWEAGHLVGARHMPLQELSGHRAEVPTEAQVWVHCGAGFRAAAAASILSGWGASPVLVDDTWDHAVAAGLAISAKS
ncbi:MAG: MBL fold metallo-hydrolase [Acidimicrobiales bacterium]|jgi:glyoxylase-like metal-dependent hydrolase (beta-lactamase superfamily II)/rhodanese-related sulfurtransferase